MTRPPAKRRRQAAPGRRAANPAEIVGQTLERALDPLRSALKSAALRRADRHARQFARRRARAAPAPTGKPGLPVSPLAVPFPPMPADRRRRARDRPRRLLQARRATTCC